ncbi:hypothetical protein DAPPUDRAFT_96891 [Daphnia pulex]|uniref:Uncharacterized protein n=2 Tax=Daphnia pulex TaxID=6669 RepID=E9FZ32_DAPPU|nr:hypothetical protein DAPPUDRAFT_96891 [Daphnia pulex]|eukprot:EFX87642.1 hypothetical protein DAPPUDRAFT_96891 [Daphnia pulex]
MENSPKKLVRRGEAPTAIPSSMTDVRFVQSLLLATPLYFYYPHLTPPGFFSGLLKGLVQMRNATEEQNVSVECGIDLTSGRDVSSRTSSGKRKSVCEGMERKAKRSKDRAEPSPKDNNSPEQSNNVSPSLP